MANENQHKKITSVKMFVDEITSLRRRQDFANAEQWFFRGQKNSAWGVHPNIFRGDDLASEHLLIERAQRQNPVEFRDCVNNFEILTKLQHYGLGTRLLDVTLNPLVALYFATEDSIEYLKNKNNTYSLKKHDGSVFYKLTNGHSLQDLQTKIVLSIPFLEFGKSISLEILCSRLEEQKTISQSEYQRLIENDYSEMIAILQKNSFIISTNSNVRLIQQRGAFLMAPAININTKSDVKTSTLSKAKMNLEKEFEGQFIIPEENKEEIRAELDFFNVNEATLFPELEHQMKYIQSQTQPPVGTVEEYKKYEHRIHTQSPVEFDKTPPDIDAILARVLPTEKNNDIAQLKNVIDDTVGALDWRLKENVISGLRRTLARILSGMFSAVEARSKANEIIEELLK